jgi:hypothetical protein
MIRIDASARKWEPLGCSKYYLALQSTSMRELRRSMEYTGRSGHNSPRNSSVELTAAHTLAVSSIGHDVVWMS